MAAREVAPSAADQGIALVLEPGGAARAGGGGGGADQALRWFWSQEGGLGRYTGALEGLGALGGYASRGGGADAGSGARRSCEWCMWGGTG